MLKLISFTATQSSPKRELAIRWSYRDPECEASLDAWAFKRRQRGESWFVWEVEKPSTWESPNTYTQILLFPWMGDTCLGYPYNTEIPTILGSFLGPLISGNSKIEVWGPNTSPFGGFGGLILSHLGTWTFRVHEGLLCCLRRRSS